MLEEPKEGCVCFCESLNEEDRIQREQIETRQTDKENQLNKASRLCSLKGKMLSGQVVGLRRTAAVKLFIQNFVLWNLHPKG